MKYNFELISLPTAGKFKASFYCEHCNQSNLYVGACLYTANLARDPFANLSEACREYVDNINNRRFNMFANKRAGKALKSSLCHCSHNVVSIQAHKAKLRAQSLLKTGLNKLHKK
jgi:hypothetical protein